MMRAAVLCPLCLAATLLPACSDDAPYEKPTTPVQIADLRRQPVGRTLRYSAVIEPATRVDLGFRVGGYVTSLATPRGRVIQEGDRVTTGMVLAVLRTLDYDEKVKQAQAQLAEAEAARVAAAQTLARAEALFASRSLTRPELEQARATLESVDARIAGANGRIREAELSRGDATLRAPISGVVIKRLVEIGSLVGPGTLGFVLADTRNVKVVLAVPDTLLSRFPPGGTAQLRSDALPDRRPEGRVTKVAPTADVRTRMFEVELTVPNPDDVLKPGMVAVVTVDDRPATGEVVPEALVLPLAAIVRPPGKSDSYGVFVMEDSNGTPTARLREVILGDVVGNNIIVLGGLTGTERVIVRGASIVSDGERVNPSR